MPRAHSVTLLGLVRPRPSCVLHHDRQVAEVGQLRRRRLEEIGVHHQLEDQVAVGERAQHLGPGHAHLAAHRADAPEPRRLHLLVEHTLDVGDRVPGTMPPMIASG